MKPWTCVLIAAACGGPRPTGEAPPIAPLARVPAHFIGGRVPITEVRIDDSAPLAFIVDTGADNELIDARLAGQLGLKIDKPQEVPQPGGAVMMGTIVGARLAVGTLHTDAIGLMSVPLAQLAPVIGRPLDGLIGHTLLRRYVVELDFVDQTIAFYDPATWHYTGGGTAVPLEISEIDAYVHAELVQGNGPPVDAKLELDTGSFDALGLADRFVQSHGLVGTKPILEVPGVAIGGETSGYRLRLDLLRLGPFELAQVPMGATRARPDAEPIAYAGTLGADVLRRFKVTLDYPHNRFYLEPNAAYRTDFEVDSSGLVLRASGEHFEHVVVHAVLPGSPADQAGLRAGDTLSTMNGKSIHGASLEQVMLDLVAPDRTSRVEIVRDGVSSSVALTTRRLY